MPGRHLDVEACASPCDAPVAAAVSRTGSAASRPVPAHVGHGAAVTSWPSSDAPDLAHLAASRRTSRTRSGCVPGAAPLPAARVALDRHARLDGLAHAEHDVCERQLERHLGVGPRGRPGCAGAAGPAEGVTAEERVEQVVEPEVARAPKSVAAAGTGAVAVVTEHVVPAAAFGIAQRLVRALHFLELLRGLRDRRGSRPGGTRARARGTPS